jgi:hypothetical protein
MVWRWIAAGARRTPKKNWKLVGGGEWGVNGGVNGGVKGERG